MRLLILVLNCVGLVCLGPLVCSGEAPAPLEGAQARIEQHRKGDITLTLVDDHGRPLRHMRVEVKLVSHDFLFGCNIFMWSQADDEFHRRYRDRFERLFNYATLPFYWWGYESKQGKTDEARIRTIAQWCRARGIVLKGHPLIWNHKDPGWLPDDKTKIQALTFGRVDTTVSDFAGTVDNWDVLNEPTAWARNAKKAPKTTAAVTDMGTIEACKEALRRARKANPQATLLINDYVTSEAYFKVLDQLRDADGALLFDAVGLQTHMHSGPRPLDDMWAVCERFAKLGVPLHLTETTVLSEYPKAELDEAATAQYIVDLYTLWFSHPAVEAITWWDFSDRGAWLKAKAGLLHADGTPKPAYKRLSRLINDTWTTSTILESDAKGVITWRGFYGTYSVAVRGGADAQPYVGQARVARRDPSTHTQRIICTVRDSDR